MIEIPFSEKFIENMDRTNSHGDNPCIICGRKIRSKKTKRVPVNSGLSHILNAEEVKQDEGEMGLWPIGSDCLKKHPEILPYIVK